MKQQNTDTTWIPVQLFAAQAGGMWVSYFQKKTKVKKGNKIKKIDPILKELYFYKKTSYYILLLL